MPNVLTVFYSRAGENYWAGGVRDLPTGNTELMARMIQEAVGGDLFQVETVEPYAADYYACTEEAKEEQLAGARPELVEYLDDAAGYDVVFVGYPNWWGTMPMAMFSFLERCDLAGKRVVPFCTNEGSGMGSSESDLERLCPGSTVEPGLAVLGHAVEKSERSIAAWAQRMAG
jgi:flavodoxin